MGVEGDQSIYSPYSHENKHIQPIKTSKGQTTINLAFIFTYMHMSQLEISSHSRSMDIPSTSVTHEPLLGHDRRQTKHFGDITIDRSLISPFDFHGEYVHIHLLWIICTYESTYMGIDICHDDPEGNSLCPAATDMFEDPSSNKMHRQRLVNR